MRKIKLIFIIMFSMLLYWTTAIAQTKTANSGGNWSNPNTWTPPGLPASTDDILIQNGIVRMDAFFTLDAGHTLTIEATGTIEFHKNDTANLTINGTIIFNRTDTNSIICTARPGGGSTLTSFVLSSGATLKTANINGVTGTNCSIDITFGKFFRVILSASADYEFFGASQSTTGMPAGVHNLTFSGSGTKTFATATIIGNNISIDAGVIANLNGLTHFTNYLYLAGGVSPSGTWGGTGSGATFENPTYFSAGIGILNVSTCIPGLWKGTTSTDWNIASNWCDGNVPTSSSDVIISLVGNEPVINSSAICNNIIINSGATLTISGSNTLNVNGNWTDNSSSAITGTVIFNNAAQTINNGTFTNLTLGGSGVKTLNGVTVNGILSMEGTATVSATPNYGVSAALQYNTSISRFTGPELEHPFKSTGGVIIANTGAITLFSDLPSALTLNLNVPLIIQSGSTLITDNHDLHFGGNFINNGTLTAGSSNVYIFDIGTQSISGFTTTGNVLMQKTGGTATFTGNVNAAAFTINGTGSTLDLGAGFTHTFTGDVTLTAGTLFGNSSTLIDNSSTASAWNGTGTVFSAGTGTVIFNGTAQTISTATTFNNLTIANTGTGVTISQSQIVSGILNMTSGNITTGTNVLTLGTSTSNLGTLSRASGVIIGKFERWFNAVNVNHVEFPIGSLSSIYLPVFLSFTGAPSTGGTLTAMFTSPAGSNSLDTVYDGTYAIDCYSTAGYWTLTNNGISSPFTYSLDIVAEGFLNGVFPNDFTKLHMLKRANSSTNWGVEGTHIVSDGSTSIPILHRTGMTGFSEFAVGSNRNDNNFNGALPVELTSFSANVVSRDVKLNWTTATERNNAGFEILRSAHNDNVAWTKVGFVTGNGTKTTPTNYSFDDRKLNTGKYNYKLKQIDYNGNFEYFNLAGEVEIGVPNKFNISQNYPNPFNPTAKIDFDLPYDSKVSIKLYDIRGREVMTLVNEQKQAGYYTVQMNGINLSSGMYFYIVVAEGNGQKYISTKKAVLIK